MQITRDDIIRARSVIAPHARRTPLHRTQLDTVAGRVEVVFKLEFTQLGGSFKVRGSLNAVLSALSNGELGPIGVVIASGGNAAIGAAWAARVTGVGCRVVLPRTAPAVKVAALRELGAEVVQIGERYQDAADEAARSAAETGALLLHAYDLPEIVAGAGTIGLELADDLDGPLQIVTCVGGGGLLAGLTASLRPGDTLVGTEPVGASCLHQALAAGAPLPTELDSIASDSLGATQIGSICWDTVAGRDDVRSVVVDDTDIIAARTMLWREHRIVVEHGTAAAVAAITTGQVRPQPDSTLCAVLCGANTAPDF